MGVLRRAGIVAAITLATGVTEAQDEPAALDVSLRTDGALIAARFDISASFNETFRRRLAGGLTSRVLVEMTVQTDGGTVTAIRARSCKMQLNVWDELVYTTIGEDGKAERTGAFTLIDDALKACGQVDIPLMPATSLNGRGPSRLWVKVALNPVSEELLERTREFLSDPRGRGTGRPRAFFGAVARLFRSESEVRGQTFSFRSGYLDVPKASP